MVASPAVGCCSEQCVAVDYTTFTGSVGAVWRLLITLWVICDHTSMATGPGYAVLGND